MFYHSTYLINGPRHLTCPRVNNVRLKPACLNTGGILRLEFLVDIGFILY